MNWLSARKGLGRLGLAAGFGLTLAGSALAVSDARWVSAGVRGMVIRLSGDHWEELVAGQELVNTTLKTLRSGRLTVEGAALTIEIEPNSMIALRDNSAGATVLFQYEGTLTLSVDGPTGPGVALRAGDLTLIDLTGKVEISVEEGSVELDVKSGTATVQSAGRSEVVKPGAYLVSDGGALSVSLTAGAGPIGAAAIASIEAGAPGAHNNSSDESHGSDSAGGNGVGGANGSENSNAGSGNNNAGGNGENSGAGNSNNAGGNSGAGNGNNAGGNSAGSGNNNAGGSGQNDANSNAGGNGGSNGGANRSSGKSAVNNGGEDANSGQLAAD